jgi:hypothetical protein
MWLSRFAFLTTMCLYKRPSSVNLNLVHPVPDALQALLDDVQKRRSLRQGKAERLLKKPTRPNRLAH